MIKSDPDFSGLFLLLEMARELRLFLLERGLARKGDLISFGVRYLASKGCGDLKRAKALAMCALGKLLYDGVVRRKKRWGRFILVQPDGARTRRSPVLAPAGV